MALEEKKALVQGFIEEVMNNGNVDAISDYCVEGSMFAGGVKGQIIAMRTPFPDMQLTIESVIAENNKVVVEMTSSATNTGPMVGLPAFGRLDNPIPPTGLSASWNVTYIFTVSDGKIVSYKAGVDQIGMLRQLGWTFNPPIHTEGL